MYSVEIPGRERLGDPGRVRGILIVDSAAVRCEGSACILAGRTTF
jgi:hypothetical protein